MMLEKGFKSRASLVRKKVDMFRSFSTKARATFKQPPVAVQSWDTKYFDEDFEMGRDLKKQEKG